MRPDSLLIFWRYINWYLITYLPTYKADVPASFYLPTTSTDSTAAGSKQRWQNNSKVCKPAGKTIASGVFH